MAGHGRGQVEVAALTHLIHAASAAALCVGGGGACMSRGEGGGVVSAGRDLCGLRGVEVAALTHLIRTASSRRDAALALSAISAVRHVAIGEGRVQPWPDSFLKAFIKVRC